jgi:hypothetical protein
MIVSSFIIQANVITIVNYDRQTFIIQATGRWQKLAADFSNLFIAKSQIDEYIIFMVRINSIV